MERLRINGGSRSSTPKRRYDYIGCLDVSTRFFNVHRRDPRNARLARRRAIEHRSLNGRAIVLGFLLCRAPRERARDTERIEGKRWAGESVGLAHNMARRGPIGQREITERASRHVDSAETERPIGASQREWSAIARRPCTGCSSLEHRNGLAVEDSPRSNTGVANAESTPTEPIVNFLV